MRNVLHLFAMATGVMVLAACASTGSEATAKSRTPSSGAFQYKCDETINTFEDGPQTSHYFFRVESGRAYVWFDQSEYKDDTSDLQQQLHAKDSSVEYGTYDTNATSDGKYHVTGPHMMSDFDNSTYKGNYLGKEMFFDKGMASGSAHGEVTVITHYHDHRSKDPKKESTPGKATLICHLG